MTRSQSVRNALTLLVAMLVASTVTAVLMHVYYLPAHKTPKPSAIVTVPTHSVQEELQALRQVDPVALRPTDPSRVLAAEVMTLNGLERLPLLEYNSGIYDAQGKPIPPVLADDVVLILRTVDGRRWVSRWDPLPQY